MTRRNKAVEITVSGHSPRGGNAAAPSSPAATAKAPLRAGKPRSRAGTGRLRCMVRSSVPAMLPVRRSVRQGKKRGHPTKSYWWMTPFLPGHFTTGDRPDHRGGRRDGEAEGYPDLRERRSVAKDWKESSRYPRWTQAQAQSRYDADGDAADGVLKSIKQRWCANSSPPAGR